MKNVNNHAAQRLSALILTLTLILCACGGKKPAEPVTPAEPTQAPAVTEAASSSSEPAESAEERERLSFSEKDIHSGDLILVSAAHAYDFEANDDTLDLKNIRENQSFYYQVDKLEFSVAGRILPALDRMIAACDEAVGTKETGITSAYRTYEYQEGVMREITEAYGEAYAKKYVAIPGFSEHHTGLAVDIGIFYEDGSQGSFSESRNAVWMRENCYRFGFVRRYAEDKTKITGISNEAWHFRYVGMPHAAFMTEKNFCLEEYIDYLREHTSENAPLSVTCADGSYDIFFTDAGEIDEPSGEYTVSGNNVDGVIVTVKREG